MPRKQQPSAVEVVSWFVPRGRVGAAWSEGPVAEVLGVAPARLRRDALAFLKELPEEMADRVRSFVEGRGARPPHLDLQLPGGSYRLRISQARAGRKVVGRLFSLTARPAGDAALAARFGLAAFSAAEALVVVLDPAGRILTYNEAVERLTGVPLARMRGKAWIDRFVPGAQRTSVKGTLSSLQSGSTPVVRLNQVITRDGSCRDIDWRNIRVTNPDGSLEFIVGVGVDVSDRVKAEAALAGAKAELERLLSQESSRRASWEGRVRFVVEQLPVTFFSIDAATGEHRWFGSAAPGESARDFSFGTWRDTILGRVREDQRDDALATVERVLREGGTYVQHLPVETSAGPRYLQVLGSATVGQDGAVNGIVGATVDVTDRVLAQQSLAIAIDRLSEAQRIAQFGHWDWDIRTNALAWSDEIYRIFGLNPGEFPATYPAFLDAVHPDDRPAVTAAVGAAVEENRRYDITHRIVRPDGTVRTVRERGRVHRDVTGHPMRMLGTVQDTTDAAEAERRVRESELKLRTLVEQAPVGILEHAPDGRVLDANAAFCRMMGATVEKLRQLDPRDFLFPEDAASVPPPDSDRPAYTGRMRAIDGSDVWVRVSIGRLLDKGTPQARYVRIVEDVTQQKRSDDALAAERRRADQLLAKLLARDHTLEQSLGALIITDADGRLTYANRAFLETWGFTSVDEVLGRFGWELYSDVDEVRACFTGLPERGVFRGTREAVRRDGTTFLADVSARFVRGEDGAPGSCVVSVLDITNQLRAENELRTSEARFKAAFDRAPIGLAEYCAERGWLRANDRFREILALAPGTLPAVPPAGFGLPDFCADGVRLDGEEVELRRADGTTVWCSLRSTPVVEPGTQPFVVLLVEDVDERHSRAARDEAAMRGTNELVRKLVTRDRVIESSINATALADLAGQLTYVNAAFVRMWRLASPDAAIGRPVTDFWAEPGQASVALQGVLEEGAWSGLLQARRADGSDFAAEVRAEFLSDDGGAPIALLATFIDVSDRVRAESELRESEARFRGIAETVSFVVWVTTADFSRILYLNPAFETVWGRARSAFMTEPLDWMATVHPDDRASVLASFRADPAHQDNLHRIVRPDGAIRWVRVKTFPVRDSTDTIIRIVGIVEDVTRDHIAAEERRLANATIERSLHEKEVLLKEVHHRVKNNLQLIASLLSLQSQKLPPAARIPLQESRDRVASIALVHENLYRSDDLGAVPFGSYLRRLVAGLREGAPNGARHVRLVVDANDDLLDVNRAVPCGLIVNELTTNALKYAFPDERPGTVQIAFGIERGVATLLVADDGVGLAAADDRREPGSLGLMLVRMLAEQLEGKLRSESAPGEGTLFRLQFPVRGEGGA